jgi:hypothetical protein
MHVLRTREGGLDVLADNLLSRDIVNIRDKTLVGPCSSWAGGLIFLFVLARLSTNQSISNRSTIEAQAGRSEQGTMSG